MGPKIECQTKQNCKSWGLGQLPKTLNLDTRQNSKPAVDALHCNYE
ncbi:predicted protein [Sclerotinia sclerotiorum 1980 UF-70]|uniref:Uncharacterized protein n=1 Tax=Sclerotinia sclerotiorum (strain ATCC 18683 / 1980 / Ss-1) TaxID=665079 RepID=A7ECY7_SCLS1|nr:predicted protein [Sclerotinia sclerotiorum 1980 UF-70]EDO00703.1 predicted protein [Sclerotinia sclerotiorum 1980 UF-70]